MSFCFLPKRCVGYVMCWMGKLWFNCSEIFSRGISWGKSETGEKSGGIAKQGYLPFSSKVWVDLLGIVSWVADGTRSHSVAFHWLDFISLPNSYMESWKRKLSHYSFQCNLLLQTAHKVSQIARFKIYLFYFFFL